MRSTTGGDGGRPMVMGRRGVVSSGHYLATECGMAILRSGGNAVDAAAATGFALTLLQPHQNGIGGEAPSLFYEAATRRVHAVSGHGIAPRDATIEGGWPSRVARPRRTAGRGRHLLTPRRGRHTLQSPRGSYRKPREILGGFGHTT